MDEGGKLGEHWLSVEPNVHSGVRGGNKGFLSFWCVLLPCHWIPTTKHHHHFVLRVTICATEVSRM